MTTRVLDWNGLIRVAERRNPADRVVVVGGVRARVRPHLSTDAGFYLATADDDLGNDAYWSLRTAPEIRLLRLLVDAGQVTVDDDEDPWRLAEWHRRLAAGERCFIAGCTAPDVDERGPVFDRAGRMHLACPAHWAGVFAELGRQHAETPNTVDVRLHEQAEPIRTMCVTCGAGPDIPHDADAHAATAAREHHRKD